MEDLQMVRMVVTRRYPRGGKAYSPGETVTVPNYAAVAMEDANPPYGRRVDPNEGIEIDGTEPALELAEAHDFDLRPYAGHGSGPGGRIYKEDVEQWLDTDG